MHFYSFVVQLLSEYRISSIMAEFDLIYRKVMLQVSLSFEFLGTESKKRYR